MFYQSLFIDPVCGLAGVWARNIPFEHGPVVTT